MASSTLIGTAPDQVPTNGDLGDLAFQNKESIEFLDGRGGLQHLDVTALSAQLNVSANDVVVYDTSKDSDGGAWRLRSQHLSWYNETLNTNIRGARRDFPAVAIIVAQNTAITIYDGDDPTMPMWMVINRYSGAHSWSTCGLLPDAAGITAVAAVNGTIAFSQNGDHKSLGWIKFLSDEAYAIPDLYWGWSKYNGSIADRQSGKGFTISISSGTATLGAGKDIAITVLTGAPIDKATGLPTPTIALATDNGVTIIKDNNTVANWSAYYNWPHSSIAIAGEYFGASWSDGNAAFGTIYRKLRDAPSGTMETSGEAVGGYPANSSTRTDPFWNMYNGTLRHGMFSEVDTYSYVNSSYGAYVRNGLYKHYLTQGTIAKSLNAIITNKYNTGWMPGDIKGAWLSDTTQETVVSAEYVTDGGFESAANWTLIQASATVTRTAESGRTGYGVTCTSTGGSNVYSGREITGLIVGKAYTFSVDYNNLNHVTNITLNTAWANSGTTIVGGSISAASGWQTLQCSFIATTTSVWLNIFAQGTIYLDNLSLRDGDADRSLNNKGLRIYGSITKTPVAAGADLVGYTGFTTSNYLYQPYNSALDIGTGDFSINVWMKPDNLTSVGFLYYRGLSDTSSSIPDLYQASNALTFRAGSTTVSATDQFLANTWQLVSAVRRNGVGYIYINGVQVSTATMTDSITDTAAVSSIGCRVGVNYPFAGSLALVRFSATAPSAEQILKMYNDEKLLFQDNAKATLYGTSSEVTAAAHDEDTGLLHAGTSSGRSTFQGLRRVSNTTTAVSSTISAANGLVAEN